MSWPRVISLLLFLSLAMAAPAQDAAPEATHVISSAEAGSLLVKKVAPDYPPLARQARIQGTVILTVTIDESGNIQSVQPFSGHPMLAPAAIAAVKQWKYQPFLIDGQPVKVETTVRVNFTMADHPKAPGVKGGDNRDGNGDDNGTDKPVAAASGDAPAGSGHIVLRATASILPETEADADHPPLARRVVLAAAVAYELLQRKVTPAYPEDARSQGIQGAVVVTVEIDKDGNVYDVRQVMGNPLLLPIVKDTVKLWQYKPYLLNGEPTAVETTAQINFKLGGEPGSAGSAAAATVTIDTGSAMLGGPVPMRVRVSSGVLAGLLITKVNPVYPPAARDQGVQGVVTLQVRIDRDGNVAKQELISGDPLLAPSAIEAVEQWKYKPYLLNGTPVEVDSQVAINFTLSR